MGELRDAEVAILERERLNLGVTTGKRLEWDGPGAIDIEIENALDTAWAASRQQPSALRAPADRLDQVCLVCPERPVVPEPPARPQDLPGPVVLGNLVSALPLLAGVTFLPLNRPVHRCFGDGRRTGTRHAPLTPTMRTTPVRLATHAWTTLGSLLPACAPASDGRHDRQRRQGETDRCARRFLSGASHGEARVVLLASSWGNTRRAPKTARNDAVE